MRRRAGVTTIRARRRGRAVLLGALALASCSTDSGVRATRSAASTTATTDAPEDTATTDGAAEPAPPEVPTTVAPETSSTVPSTAPPTSGEPTGGGSLHPSGDGAGDALFPDLGNPGVDVLDYDVALSYDDDTDTIDGIVTMTIALTDTRRELTLDAAGPVVSRVTVDGADAPFAADDPELRITLPAEVAAGAQVEVGVAYTVTPSFDGNSTNMQAGWFSTEGGSYVLNEPDGARTWLPSNDHPSDKATWTFSITVDAGTTAVANGVLVSSDDGPDGATWVWRQEQPMPTYLILLITGQYELVEGATATGLPLLSAVLRDDRAKVQPYLDSIAAQIDFFDDLFGPYPLDRYGLAITDSLGGLAMETQGRSLFSRSDLNGDAGYLQELLLSHELAHQWYGNAVSPLEWQDIWLNESFATYGQWMWLEHAGLTTVEGEATGALDARAAMGGSPTGLPTVNDLFGYNSYDGGAVVLHALRLTIGDDAFFTVLRRWVADHAGTSRSTEDFILLAEEVAGRDLGELFDTWLFAPRPPRSYP